MFHLKEQNGQVNYIMMAGKDIVRHHIPLSTATLTCEHRPPTQEAIAGHPEYCIHSGAFFFEGTWDRPKRKRKKDEVCE